MAQDQAPVYFRVLSIFADQDFAIIFFSFVEIPAFLLVFRLMIQISNFSQFRLFPVAFQLTDLIAYVCDLAVQSVNLFFNILQVVLQRFAAGL